MVLVFSNNYASQNFALFDDPTISMFFDALCCPSVETAVIGSKLFENRIRKIDAVSLDGLNGWQEDLFWLVSPLNPI